MIARFQRMQGKRVFYPFGFDDNGLPTERLVKKRRRFMQRMSHAVNSSSNVWKLLPNMKQNSKNFGNLYACR
jgi:valyl-tRNA synthetase